MECINKHACSRWDPSIGTHGGGYVYGEYELFTVKEVVETIVITKYERLVE